MSMFLEELEKWACEWSTSSEMHERKPITLILLDVTLKSVWTHIGSVYYVYLENTITLENTTQIKIRLVVFD